VKTSFEFDFPLAGFLFDKRSPITRPIVTSAWSSKGWRVNKSSRRWGRCSIVLNKEGDVWEVIHTYFSLTPNGEL